MLAPNLNPVRLDVAPGDLRVIEQYAAPECTPNLIAFCRRKSIGLQHVQNPREEGIILGELRFDELKPRLHLNRRQDIRLFKGKRLPCVLAAPEYPIELAPLLKVFRADVAGCGDTISGSALELVVPAHFVKRIRPGAVLIRLFQIE